MPKALTFTGMIVAGLLLLMFGADLAVRIPLGRYSWKTDVVFVACALILLYLSWSTFREQV